MIAVLSSPELNEIQPTAHQNPRPSFFTLHQKSLILGGLLIVAVGLVHALNMHGWPGRVNDDEGTYVAQAWAVVYRNSLAHYTYAYDHPPLGWIVIACYAWLTDGFARTSTALMVGREVMLLTNLVSTGLIYLLARRLHLRRVFAAVVVILFAFSPVALQYHRMVFLDNLAIAWALAALVFAATPRRSLAAAVGCGLTFGCAVLTKETIAILLPVVIWTLVQHTDRHTRRWNLSVAGFLMFGVGFLYPLFSILKNEFLEGPGHVSLLGAIWWQLFERAGSGSLLDSTSDTYLLARSWLELDPWLLAIGTVLIPAAFLVKGLRPVALALLLQVAVMFRGGYLPYPYVICLLPFAALLIGGVANSIWSIWRFARPDAGSRHRAVRHSVGALAVLGACLVAYSAAPGWAAVLRESTTADLSGPPMQATQWIERNVPKDAVIIVDDYVWPDLALRGYQNQIWSYKADLDPEVRATLLPAGWASADYVALDEHADHTLDGLPTVVEVIEHSEVVASFGEGQIVIRKVIKPRG